MVIRNFPQSRITSRLPKAKGVQDVDVSYTTPTKYFPTAAHGTKVASNVTSVTESLTPGLLVMVQTMTFIVLAVIENVLALKVMALAKEDQRSLVVI